MTLEDLLSQLMELTEKGENVQVVGGGYNKKEKLSVQVLVEYRDKEFVVTVTYWGDEDDGDEGEEDWEPCYACEAFFRWDKEWHAHYPATAIKELANDIRKHLGSKGFVYLQKWKHRMEG